MKFPETKTLQPGSIKRTGLWWRRSDGPFYLDPEAQTQPPPNFVCLFPQMGCGACAQACWGVAGGCALAHAIQEAWRAEGGRLKIPVLGQAWSPSTQVCLGISQI